MNQTIRWAVQCGLISFREGGQPALLASSTIRERRQLGRPLERPKYVRDPATKKYPQITVRSRDNRGEYIRQWKALRKGAA